MAHYSILSCKSFSTDKTFEWANAGMNLHMRIKIAFVTESTVAGFALEGSFFSMSSDMSCKIATLCETPPTKLANVRLYACMYPHVCSKASFVREAI